MDLQLAFICMLTFIIHLIGTLAYSVRIAGVRTRRIAVSFALFNILVLVSRTANSFQSPFLAKRIEDHLIHASQHSLLADFRWLLLSATVATLIGGFLIPSFQRLFSKAVRHFQAHRSVPKLLLHGFLKGGIRQLREVMVAPASGSLKGMNVRQDISVGMMAMNVAAVALWTVGVFAALYAGYLDPEVRMTSSNLSAIVNGVATVMMFVFIDPQLSVMTDDVMEGKMGEPQFRRVIIWLVGSRLLGTLLAQLLLLPASRLIAAVAGWL